jgi:Zn-dependent M28 family amino/carboxypeptidase
MRKIHLKTSIYSFFLYVTVFLFISCSGKEGAEVIQKDPLHSTTSELSSEKFNGRLAGSEEYNKAAGFVADFFEEHGLKKIVDDSYFQSFNIEYNEINDLAFARIQDDGEVIQYEPGKDFVCRGFSGSGNIEAPIVFCGYGISRPELGYDDYKNVDVSGKIVMLFKYDPRWKINDEKIAYNSLRKKAAEAKAHGAKGIIYISSPSSKNPQKPIGSVMHGEGEHLEDMPQIHVSVDVAEELAENSKESLSTLQNYINNNKKPRSVQLHTTARINVVATYKAKKKTMNVVGMVEGNDEELKNEYIILGAHLDHVGNQGGKVLFPGANDNASGVASIMHVAKALSTKKDEIKRSVIFVAFSSEEQGLQGANYFVDHSPVATDKIVAMLNMDCVAHGDSIVLGGGKSFPELYNIAKGIDKQNKSLVIDRTWRGGGADATPFYEQGIPTLYFATRNSYTHLHLPTDKPETLNQKLHAKITKLAYRIVHNLAKGNYKKEKEQ